MKSVVLDVLKRYLQVETQFQQGDTINLSGNNTVISGFIYKG